MTRRWRLDFASWSTFGQTALLIFGALAVAQLFTFFLLRNITEQWQRFIVVNPAVNRFVEIAQDVAASPRQSRWQIVFDASAEGQHFGLSDSPPIPDEARVPPLEDELKSALKKHHLRFADVRASRRGRFPGFGPPGRRMDVKDGKPEMPPFAQDRAAPDAVPEGSVPPFAQPGDRPRRVPRFYGFGGLPPAHMNDEVRLAVRLADGSWIEGRFLTIRPLPLFLNPMVVSQVALFITVLVISLIWASRISRPLRILARAAENLRPQEALSPVPEEGPRDVRAAIVSFNAMAQRVKDMVEEKDRMLSAIGHDLRTPLASLRIRAESLEPESERERVVETIDEMTRMVDEILGFARLGHTAEARVPVDLSALADAVVEEFRELGKNVTFDESPRTPIKMQPSLVRRVLRNLIDNAVKYGERARVSVVETGDAVDLAVEDDGPGIPAEALADVLRPFTRLEQSRSRQTGGIGLGLSIADAIARSQGARLVLANRPGGGLRATVRWPKTAPAEGGS